MGLAAPRIRTKISDDPRNTAWSNSTTRFGHRILTTLGWTPGSTLGDSTSSYHTSGHITEASQAGVKIVLKDDNLGIGCNKRAREDQCVGLDGLQDLLGRLNGKGEEQLGKEAESRDKLRREVIVSQRYGMRFVRGETYVSSDIETLLKRIEKEKKSLEEGEKTIKKEEEEEGEEEEKGEEEEEGEEEGSNEELVKAEDTESSSVSVKKEKRSKREKSSSKSASVTPAETDTEVSFRKRKRTDDDDSRRTVKKENANKEKKAPKMSKKSKNGETHEERRTRREKEKSEKETRKVGKRNKKRKSSSDSALSGTATPSYPALVGRQALRHRYIAAKRSSVMDAKALNEIFMIKA